MAGLIRHENERPDVRLVLPALLAWACVAMALPAPTAVVVGATAVAVLGGVASAVLARRGKHPVALRTVCAALLFVALVLAAVLGHRGVERAGSVPALAEQGAVVHVEAIVTSDPRVIGDGAERADKVLLRMTVTQVAGRGVVSRTATPVIAFADMSWQKVRWHDRVRVKGRLRPAEPGDDVAAALAIRGGPTVVAGPGPVDQVAEHVRGRFRAATDPLPADARGLVPALVIGDTSRTPKDLSDAMRETSLTHLSAVSGSNVSVVLGCLLWLCGLVGIPRRFRWVAALLGLAAFVVLARPEPSVIRAAVMGAVGLVAITANRRRAGMPALGAAIVLLLVINPWLARSFGFALSALATLGLLLFARPWGEALGRRLPARLAGLGPVLAIPIAAQVMCAPVTLLLQPGVSVVGIPANILAEPMVGPATMAGVAAACASVVWVPLGSLCAWVAALPALGIAQVARRAADLPYGTLPWPEGTPGVVALVTLSAIVVLSGRRIAWWARLRPFLAAGLVIVVLALLVPVRSAGWPLTDWAFAACDVGQGDALVLASGHGRAVVVDTGPDPKPLLDCLRGLDVHAVDALVLTHFDADHMSGAAALLGAYRVGHLYGPAVDLPARNAETVYRAAADHGVEVTRVRAGDRIDVGDLHAEALWPARVLGEGSRQNNAATVLLADARGTRVLLTADIEREAAAQLVSALRGREHAIDVLKVAHHGSSNADPRLAGVAAAPLAVISVGENTYGHPAAKTLASLAAAGSQVVRTDRCGDIVVSGHGESLRYACGGPR